MSFDTEQESKCYGCGKALAPAERHRLDPEDEVDYCEDCIEIALHGTAKKAPAGPRVHEVESVTVPFHQLRFEFFDRKGVPLSDLDRASMRDIGRNILVHGPGIDPHRVKSVALPNIDYSAPDDLMAEVALWPQSVVDGQRKMMGMAQALAKTHRAIDDVAKAGQPFDKPGCPMKMLRCEKHQTDYAVKEEGVTIGECPWCMKEERDNLLDDLPFKIRFDGPPGPEAGRFVEIETLDGRSMDKGRWEQEGDYWVLIIDGTKADGKE
jgi:hypothetical protein